MDINYKITEYFEQNNLFDSQEFNGITVKNEAGTLTISGTSRDLVELADLLVNVATDKEKSAHIHIDDLSLLNKGSDFTEVVLEKK